MGSNLNTEHCQNEQDSAHLCNLALVLWRPEDKDFKATVRGVVSLRSAPGDHGTLTGSPCVAQADLSRVICSRLPSAELTSAVPHQAWLLGPLESESLICLDLIHALWNLL